MTMTTEVAWSIVVFAIRIEPKGIRIELKINISSNSKPYLNDNFL